MLLSIPEVVDLARKETGWRGDELVTAVAVAIGESGIKKDGVWFCRADVINDNAATGDYSIGVWQVNYVAKYRAERIKKYGPPEGQKDPVTNARTAWRIYHEEGNDSFRPWGAFNNQSFRKFIPIAEAAVGERSTVGFGYCYNDAPTRCAGHALPGTAALRTEVMVLIPQVGNSGDYVCRRSRTSSNLSRHAGGTAWDAKTSTIALNHKVRDWAIAAAQDLGVQRVIADRHEWDSRPGQRYLSNYSGPDHRDHVHIELCNKAARELTRAQVRAAIQRHWSGSTQEDDLTDEQARKLDAVYDAIFTDEAEPRNRISELDKRIKEAKAEILAAIQQ